MGFVNTFRFGNPFFLQPNVDEVIWRTQLKENFSIVAGNHTFKFGGEWLHTVNDQVFRGFFTGRYIFDSVTGFLRYASPARGRWPQTQGSPRHVGPPRRVRLSERHRQPVLLYLRSLARHWRRAVAGASDSPTRSPFRQDKCMSRPPHP